MVVVSEHKGIGTSAADYGSTCATAALHFVRLYKVELCIVVQQIVRGRSWIFVASL